MSARLPGTIMPRSLRPNALAADQLAEVLAVCWIGQGTYEASEWDEALEEATEEANPIEEMLDMPMLPSVLEAGMAAFDLNCDGAGAVS